ncbi:MAG: hypothetical protein ABEL51_15735 [Salinibacter sp.]
MPKYRATATGYIPVELDFELDVDESDGADEPGLQSLPRPARLRLQAAQALLDHAEDVDGEQWTITDRDDVSFIEITNIEPVEEG